MICTRRKRWVPLVLRWRRARSLRPFWKTVRMKSTVSLSFFPQVHLHFTTVVSNQNHQRTVQNSFLSATTVNRERVFRPRINTDFVLRVLERKNHISFQKFSKHVRLYASSQQRAPIPNQIQQLRQSASVTSVFTTRQNTRREEQTRVFQTHSHTREHRAQSLSFRSERETSMKSAQIYFDRSEDLVWRRTIQRSTVTEYLSNNANNPEITNQQQQSGGARVVETHAHSAPPAINHTTPQDISKLDPRFVDRLTEDVIRRVEKRALIERQRRGL